MTEYVDKQELLRDLERKIKADNERRMAVVDSDFIDLVNDATVIEDVVEVKHGYWTAHPASYECSICENEFFVEGYAEDYDAVEDWDLHYCPNCGAKMDGERKEQK